MADAVNVTFAPRDCGEGTSDNSDELTKYAINTTPQLQPAATASAPVATAATAPLGLNARRRYATAAIAPASGTPNSQVGT